MEDVLADLQKQLAKKNTFEGAISSLTQIVSDLYPQASPSDQKSIYTTVCRAATLLKTRYTAVGFWMAGLQLFEATQKVVSKPEEKESMKSYIAKACEIIGDLQQETPAVQQAGRGPGFLFEGQLTVDPEPPRPAWLVAHNLLTALVSEHEQRNANPGQTSGTNAPQLDPFMTDDLVELMMQRENGLSDFGTGLEEAIEATLQEAGAMPRGTPPASKEEVAKLPVHDVTESLLKQLGGEVECCVCREQLAIGDQMQEMPCKHQYHPDCLKPWLDERNSCPICRFELRTDDHDYESKKERDKEFEEERKGAENAVRGGEFMYI
ncbi:hypothetical protein GOP47_0001619 [Adiantum capillus-veneris]|uniref:RING-type E3 ubiquitin transferase n=1 Tax=Adiantum capillus-veneris TaxID=13818 RepID=A0A9D4V9W7_ADICA|nr:hypothetical protein GOP47_0001619 [Adiantum capillus-veneris]